MSATYKHEISAPQHGPPKDFGKQKLNWTPFILLLPLLIVLLAFFIIPLSKTVLISFYSFTGPATFDSSRFTLENYVRFWDPFYLRVLWRTIRISLIVSFFSVLIGYPVAYYMTTLDARTQRLYMLIYLAPWMVNVVVKAFGWTLLLSRTGYINQFLLSLGIIQQPLALMFNEFGIIIALIHGQLIFAIMPIYSSLVTIDPDLRWAAANLGAKPWQIFTRIIFPLSLPGVVAGSMIVFALSMSAFTTPALLGGVRARVLPFLAYEHNVALLDWPFGSVIALIMVVVTISILFVYQVMMSSGKRKVILK